MSSLVPHNLRRLYTANEFMRLPVDFSFRIELQDGVILVSPRPTIPHQRALLRLGAQIGRQLPGYLDVLPQVAVDLPLPTPVVRVPDLVVLRSEGGDPQLAVEVLALESTRVDTKIKLLEYADAGIPNYWVVDAQLPVTATVYRLYDHGYEESQRAEHTFTVDEPCKLTIDLDALLPD